MKYPLFILLSLLTFDAFTQTLTVSEEIPINSDIAYDILGEMGNHILLFHDRNTTFEVQAFNPQLRESWRKEIFLDKRLPKVLGILPTQEDFTVIYSFRQKGNTIIKAHRYDPGANLVDSATLVDLGYLFFTPRFEMIRSQDRSKLMMYYVENQNQVHAYAFDLPTQSQLWQRSFLLEDILFGRDFVQSLIDNRGQASFIFQKDNFRSRRKQHYYQIHTYFGNEEPIRINIPMQEYLTYDVYFEADNLNNQIVAAGLYSEENTERAMGYFYFRYQPLKNEQPALTFSPFEEEFLQNLLNRNYREGKGLNETSAREIILRRDGGALLVAERNRQVQRRNGTTSRVYYETNASRGLVDFYYEEVFVLSIHPTGELHWETILHKKQYSQDDNGIYSSYFLFETPGRLRFLFNDEIRYENTVSEYVINGLGEYDRNSIFSTARLDLRLRFRDAVQISPRSVVIPSERRNRLRLVRLAY